MPGLRSFVINRQDRTFRTVPSCAMPMTPRYVSLALCATLLAACGGGEETQADKAPDLVIGGDGTDASTSSLYQMPTPNELFSLVRDMAGEGHKRMLNPTSNADRYVSLRSRAVNFGVYSTDLVYASYFKLDVEVARYYLATKKLADGLGVASAFTDADFVRLESNLTRGDSLEIISSEAYMKAYEKMQHENMGPTLAMVLVGGWVESMHLVIRQIEAFGKTPPLMARVAEQKVTLEQLVELLGQHTDNADVTGLRQQLVAIRDIYDQVGVKRVVHEGKSSSGRMVLGEDVDLDMSDEKYRSLMEAVDQLRTELTRPEDKTNA
jgi:hypothetical protein